MEMLFNAKMIRVLVNAFVGVCVYNRTWIEKFVPIAEPIYRLMKKTRGIRVGTRTNKSYEPIKTGSD